MGKQIIDFKATSRELGRAGGNLGPFFMTNVITLPVVTAIDLPVDRILSAAQDRDLSVAVVIGRNQDGSLYFASSQSDGADVLWLMRHAELELFKCANVL